MEFTLKTGTGFLEIKLSGKANLDVYRATLNALNAHDEWDPGTPLLLDETELDTSALTNAEVKAIAEMFTGMRAVLGQSKVATVVARDLEFGMHRMFEVYVGDKIDTRGRLFRSRTEAVAWLKNA